MLLGQHGGRHQHGHLLAIHHGLERCTQGHFGFAVTDVAADQAVHRLGGFHVALDVGDGAQLVVGFWKGKGLLKIVLPWRIGREGVALQRGPARLGFQHLRGEIVRGARGSDFFFGPALAAQRVQRRLGAPHPDIAAEQVRLAGGHIEPRLVGIFHGKGFLQLAVEDNFIEAKIFADAVLHVHDQFARTQIAPVGQPFAGGVARGAAARFATGGERAARTVQIGFGHGHPLGSRHFATATQAAQPQVNALGFAERRSKTPPPRIRREKDIHRPAGGGSFVQLREPFLALGFEDIRRHGLRRQRGQTGHGMRAGVVRQVRAPGRQLPAARAAAGQHQLPVGIIAFGGQRGFAAAGQLRAHGVVVGDGLIVQPQKRGIRRHIIRGRGGGAIRGGVARGWQPYFAQFVARALLRRIKRAEAFEHIAKKLETYGPVFRQRPHIQQTTTTRSLPFGEDFALEGVTCGNQLAAELFKIALLLFAQVEGILLQLLRRGHRFQQCLYARHQQPPPLPGQALPQGIHPLAADIGRRLTGNQLGSLHIQRGQLDHGQTATERLHVLP